MHDHGLIEAGEDAGSVSNDDHDCAARSCRRDRPIERSLALWIEVRVRLVEHDEKRIAVHRPGQGYALALTGRQLTPPMPT